jgi:hypothetical protein
VIGFVLLAGESVANSADKMKKKDLPENGVWLIAQPDRDYGDKLRQLKIDSNAAVAAAAAHSVVIHNRGNRGIVAYALQWKRRGADGREHGHNVCLAAPAGLQFARVNQAQTASRAVIAPGGLRFVSPQFSTDGADGATPPPAFNPKAAGAQAQSNAPFASALEVTVALDGVLFDDGEYVGPDETGFSELLQAQLSAQHDIKLTVHLSRKAEAPDVIFAKLAKVAEGPIAPPTDRSDPRDWYNFYRKQTAESLIRARGIAGNDGAYALVYDHLFQGRPRIKKRGIGVGPGNSGGGK